ncbi:MAG: hypothetical protein IPP07_14305 [Holophagales bacterium]|jgi:hypothetical protein|nr:hypothetical protein [Holophagales bacterium]MBK9966007.1 hypothetical protein [Holophagales bacterium]
MRRGQAAVAAFIALLVHSALVFAGSFPSPRHLWGDEITYAEAATRISAGLPAGLDLLWPPLYPRLLAWLGAPGSLLGVTLVQALALLGAALLLRDLVSRSGAPGLPADLAGFLLMADPSTAAFAHYLWPEVLHLFLFLFAIWIVVARGGRALWLVLLGIVLGAALLLKSLLGPFLPVLLVPVVLWAKGWRRLANPALALLGVVALTLPVRIANERREGAFVVADSARFNLWVGLNDRSRRNLVDEIVGEEYGRWRESGANLAERNGASERRIREYVAQRGLPAILAGQLGKQYFRLFDKDSFLSDQLPGGAIAAQGYGYVDPPPVLAAGLRVAAVAAGIGILLAAAAGLVLAPRPLGMPLRLLALFLAYNLGLFLVLHVKTRYRVQLAPVLLAFGATLLPKPGALFAAASPLRRAAVVAAALLALFLAVGGPLLP